jgi:hypothetical protein
MSKKAKRRAARQAFPKAKVPATSKGRSSSGVYRSRSRSTAAQRSRSTGGSRDLKPPSIKKAVILAVILGFAYFAVIQWGWKSGSSTQGNAIVAILGAIVYGGVIYGVDWFKYRRKTRS